VAAQVDNTAEDLESLCLAMWEVPTCWSSVALLFRCSATGARGHSGHSAIYDRHMLCQADHASDVSTFFTPSSDSSLPFDPLDIGAVDGPEDLHITTADDYAWGWQGA